MGAHRQYEPKWRQGEHQVIVACFEQPPEPPVGLPATDEDHEPIGDDSRGQVADRSVP